VSDLCSTLNVGSLNSRANFQSDSQALDALCEKITEYNKLRTHFAANIAESINNAKVFVVKAELALNMGDMTGTKKNYTLVQQENGTLLGEYMKRRNNHEELMNSLKALNSYIMKIANLRVGTSKQTVIQKCRDAIKRKATFELVRILEHGDSS
jgi:hypothetical protein